MDISADVLKEIQDHAVLEYPKEACGVLSSGKYHPIPNSALDPTRTFYITPGDLAPFLSDIQAVIHSHPYKPATNFGRYFEPQWPSAEDMRAWMQFSVPFGILATDGEGTSDILWMDDSHLPPLVGREFIHGTQDCYALIRDFYRQELGILLKNYPRDWGWWERGPGSVPAAQEVILDGVNLYERNFRDAGFRDVTGEDGALGDVILYQIQAPVPNHASIICGPDSILHHLIGRVSEQTDRQRWQRFEVRQLRFTGN